MVDRRPVLPAVPEDALLSDIAAAIGEPARTRMLLSLLDGRARTSTELAALARISPSTASAHLNRLRQAGLIRLAAQGRHRYYSLRNAKVARVLEGLSILAGGTNPSFLPTTPQSLRRARTCYDHLAGTLAVALHDHFLQQHWLIPDPSHSPTGYQLTPTGARRFASLGIAVDPLQHQRRKFAFACLDWSERRPHLAGALGAALLTHAFARRWLTREPAGRALCLTTAGQKALRANFGLSFPPSTDL